jgi:DNA-binding CsgD family transcriptional regulator
VLAWIADGKCAADIAREQYYSVDTVKAHLQRIYRKLGASNAAHAVHLAHRAGMLGAAADGAEGGAA